jgi:hypothetical protein
MTESSIQSSSNSSHISQISRSSSTSTTTTYQCAGHSMTDVTRLLENPVEATTIVQKFVLLLIENVV